MTTTDGARFVVDVRALMGKPGAYQRLTLTGAAGPAVGTAVVTVAEGEPVTADVMLESVREGILVTGGACTTGDAVCSRCLDPVRVDLQADLQELYAWSIEEAELDDLGEPGPHLDGENLDLRPPIRDGLILEMPLAPLCATDCLGLCAQCGARLADDPGHAHETSDPRWAALSALKADLLDEQAETPKEN
ncbi:MAG: YceD family protein [Candidatus Nanopelagicales bacterium]